MLLDPDREFEPNRGGEREAEGVELPCACPCPCAGRDKPAGRGDVGWVPLGIAILCDFARYVCGDDEAKFPVGGECYI